MSEENNVREVRSQEGITISRLSQMAGISAGTLMRIEQGASVPLRTKLRIVRAFNEITSKGYTIDYLFPNESERSKNKASFEYREFGGPNTAKHSIIRSIQFPPEYCQAGLGILNYFSRIVAQKYPNLPVKVTIEQEDTIVRLLIDTADGELERVEHTFEEYGLVVTGNISPEQFLSDPIDIIELRNELRIAHVRIENQRERLEARNVEVTRLYQLIEEGTRSTRTLYRLLQQLIAQQEGAVQQALTTLQETMRRGVSSDDETTVKEALITIGKHDPAVFQRVVEIVGVGAISGTAGNQLTLWLQHIGRRLGL